MSAPPGAESAASARRAERRRAFVLAALRLGALFAVVFYGADELAALRATRWQVHAGWELAMPFWPAAFVVYVSVFALPFLPLVMLPDAAHVRRWELAMGISVLAAGLVFIAFPMQLGYAPVADAGAWQPLVRLARLVAGRHNLLPSLHVALSLVTVIALWPWAGARRRALLALWFIMLAASTLVTHQHHVADVVSGVVLAAAASRWAGRRRALPPYRD